MFFDALSPMHIQTATAIANPKIARLVIEN
jgi:hypothetical protein